MIQDVKDFDNQDLLSVRLSYPVRLSIKYPVRLSKDLIIKSKKSIIKSINTPQNKIDRYPWIKRDGTYIKRGLGVVRD